MSKAYFLSFRVTSRFSRRVWTVWHRRNSRDWRQLWRPLRPPVEPGYPIDDNFFTYRCYYWVPSKVLHGSAASKRHAFTCSGKIQLNVTSVGQFMSAVDGEHAGKKPSWIARQAATLCWHIFWKVVAQKWKKRAIEEDMKWTLSDWNISGRT